MNKIEKWCKKYDCLIELQIIVMQYHVCGKIWNPTLETAAVRPIRIQVQLIEK